MAGWMSHPAGYGPPTTPPPSNIGKKIMTVSPFKNFERIFLEKKREI
jgi:hypothetical protein